MPLHFVVCKRKEGQGKHNWLWNNDILIPWKYVPDVELRWVYGRSQFVDGTYESIESYKGTTFQYDNDSQCFRVYEQDGKSFSMFPRDFIKSIRYIEV